MVILYHITPTKKLASILQEGLRVGYGESGGIAEERIKEPDAYFFKSLKDVKTHAGYSTEPGRWSLLRVRLPRGRKLRSYDEY